MFHPDNVKYLQVGEHIHASDTGVLGSLSFKKGDVATVVWKIIKADGFIFGIKIGNQPLETIKCAK